MTDTIPDMPSWDVFYHRSLQGVTRVMTVFANNAEEARDIAIHNLCHTSDCYVVNNDCYKIIKVCPFEES